MWRFGNPFWIVSCLLGGFILFSCISNAQCKCSSVSNIGREFYIGHPLLLGMRDFHYILYIASESPGTVFVDSPAYGINKSYSLIHGSNEIHLDHALPKALTDPTKAAYLKSDVDISVAVFSYGNPIRFIDIFLALPVQALSTDYIVASSQSLGPDYPDYPIDVVIVGTEQDTTVSEISASTGDSELTIGRLDAFYNGTYTDLTGLRIHSNKPVAVVSAVAAAVVPSNGKSRYGVETIVDSMLPNTFGGYSFVVPHLPTRNNYVIKILAIHNETMVHFQNSSSYMNRTIHDFGEYLLGNEAIVITATKPVLVYQYGLNTAQEPYSNYKGTFMRSVPSTDNFVTNAPFVVQSRIREIDNYLQVITQDPSAVYIDNKPLMYLSGSSIVRQTYVANNQLFSVISMETKDLANSNSHFHVIHAGNNAVFGALLSGYAGHVQEAYGYPVGIKTNVCDGSLTPTPSVEYTSMSTSSQSTQSATTQSSAVTQSSATTTAEVTSPIVTTEPTLSTTASTTYLLTTSSNTNATDQGPLCLQCDDLTHLYLCEAFVRCSTEQMCYVERYHNSAGQKRFRTGCKESGQCHSGRKRSPSSDINTERRQAGTHACSECCHGNFCNNDGCGAERFPYPRGPACLTCLHALSVDECNTVSYCQPDEVCSIQVSAWFGPMRKYQMQCASKQCVHTKRAVDARSTSVLCHECCSSDYCNHECKSNSPDPGIIG